MFIAMNRFQVKKGSEDAFEKVWLTRETYLEPRSGLCRIPSAQGARGGGSHALCLAYRLAEQGGLRGMDQIG